MVWIVRNELSASRKVNPRIWGKEMSYGLFCLFFETQFHYAAALTDLKPFILLPQSSESCSLLVYTPFPTEINKLRMEEGKFDMPMSSFDCYNY